MQAASANSFAVPALLSVMGVNGVRKAESKGRVPKRSSDALQIERIFDRQETVSGGTRRERQGYAINLRLQYCGT